MDNILILCTKVNISIMFQEFYKLPHKHNARKGFYSFFYLCKNLNYFFEKKWEDEAVCGSQNGPVNSAPSKLLCRDFGSDLYTNLQNWLSLKIHRGVLPLKYA